MLDMNQLLMLNTTIVLRGLGDKYWALDTLSGNQYKLNEVSYFILNLLRTPASMERAVGELLKEYAVARKQAEIDCDRVLRFAVEKDIVKEVNS